MTLALRLERSTKETRLITPPPPPSFPQPTRGCGGGVMAGKGEGGKNGDSTIGVASVPVVKFRVRWKE